MSKKKTKAPNIILSSKEEEAYNMMLNSLWLDIGDVRDLVFENKLLESAWDDPNKLPELIVDLCLEPEYIHFFIKHILNLTIMPYQAVMLSTLWTTKLPLLIGSRGSAKSFTLAIYIVMRAVLHQGCNITIVGASLRQSMVLYNYVEKIWHSAPVLRDICGGDKGRPKKELHMSTWTVGRSRVIWLPLGDGCVSHNTLIHSNNGIEYINKDFKQNILEHTIERDKLLWDGSKFGNSTYAYFNGLRPTIKVTSSDGYTIEGTHNHKVKVCDRGDIVWKRLDELTLDDNLVIDRKESWHTNYNDVSNDEAYALGLMIGDGYWTEKNRVGFATAVEQSHLIVDLNKSQFFDFKQRENDPVHSHSNSQMLKNAWLEYWQMEDKLYSHQKYLPPRILSASKDAMRSCLQGLFDADGSLQISTKKGGIGVAVSYTTVSERLAKEMQYVLLRFGVIAHLKSRNRNALHNDVWELLITGYDAYLFTNRIGFRLLEKQNKLEEAFTQKDKIQSFTDSIPIMEQVLEFVKENEKLVKARRGDKDDWYVAYAELKRKKTCTRSLLQKLVRRFDVLHHPFIEKIKILIDEAYYFDRVHSLENSEALTYDLHVPDGNTYIANGFISHNTTIRGQRANIVIADEAASISDVIFETVVRGFASVKSDGLIENVIQQAKEDYFKDRGEIIEKGSEYEDVGRLRNKLSGNQIVMAGTAYYRFNHFFKYYSYYKTLITSGGDVNLLKKEFPDMIIDPQDLNPEDYAIMRFPYAALPKGMMDKAILSQGRATMDPVIYDMEYNSIFPADSQGFYLASLLESATCPIVLTDGSKIDFTVKRHGESGVVYAMGIDPASEDDNFAISIIEVRDNYRGFVYQWTTNRKKFEEMQREGWVDDSIKDYNTFCIRHIRDLNRRFNIRMICCDAGGGGVSLREGLKDPDKMQPGDLPIYDMDDDSTVNMKGERKLRMIEFSSADWRRESHYGLRIDMSNKQLLFPSTDAADYEIRQLTSGPKAGKDYDSDGDIEDEILQCRTETTMIQHKPTPGGTTERWDIPEAVGLDEEQRRKRLKKDRFTSLLLANWAARCLNDKPYSIDSSVYTAVKRGTGFQPTTVSKGTNANVSILTSRNGRKIVY